jgi:undecaprenyl-diphosphatase
MDIIQAIFLGAVQGLTEFLPISSSGHLAIFQKIFNLKESPIFFDTIVHLGTLLAVIFYLRKEIVYILKTIREKETIKFIFLIIIATIPAVFAGLFLEDKIESIFSSMTLIGICFLITSIILFSTKFLAKYEKSEKELKWYEALFVGIFQAFAILPGISRSGSTMAASIFVGLKKEDAFRFSFLLSIPVISGAFILQFTKQDFILFGNNFLPNLLGFIVAIIFGLLSLKIIEKVLIRGKLHYFAIYTFVLGVLILILL